MASIATLYRDQGRLEDAAKMEATISVLSKDQQNLRDEATRIAGSFDMELMMLFLEREGGHLKITEELTAAAAGKEKDGLDIMEFLLARGLEAAQITSFIVRRAVANQRWEQDIVRLLLKEKGTIELDTWIAIRLAQNVEKGEVVARLLLEQEQLNTRDLVMNARTVEYMSEGGAGRAVMNLFIDHEDGIHLEQDSIEVIVREFNIGTIRHLLDRRVNAVRVTQNVFEAAAKNPSPGEVIELIMTYSKGYMTITEGMVKVTEHYKRSESYVMRNLLEKFGGSLKLTTAAVVAIAGHCSTDAVSALLSRLQWLGEENVRQRVVKAAANNSHSQGGRLMRLVMQQSWWSNSRITTKFLATAAANSLRAQENLELLLHLVDNHHEAIEDLILATMKLRVGMGTTMKKLLRKARQPIFITKRIIQTMIEHGFDDALPKVLFLLEFYPEKGDKLETKLTPSAVAEIAGGASQRGSRLCCRTWPGLA